VDHMSLKFYGKRQGAFVRCPGLRCEGVVVASFSVASVTRVIGV
jgi:hypothetical protein